MQKTAFCIFLLFHLPEILVYRLGYSSLFGVKQATFSDCFYLFKISQNLDHLTCTYVISPNFLRKCKTSGSWIYSSN